MKILGKEDWLTRGQSLAEHGDHGAVQYPYGPVVDSVRTALGRASLAVRVVTGEQPTVHASAIERPVEEEHPAWYQRAWDRWINTSIATAPDTD